MLIAFGFGYLLKNMFLTRGEVMIFFVMVMILKDMGEDVRHNIGGEWVTSGIHFGEGL